MQIQPHSSIVSTLLGAQNEQFVIPSYQRRYSWRKEQLLALLTDIDMIESTDSHLLGTILCLTGSHSGTMNSLELVDGQQRLTTISIVLECLKERFSRDGYTEQEADLRRLLQAKIYGGEPVAKIALDTLDSDDFTRLAACPPKPTDKFKNACLETAFREARGWIDERETQYLTKFLEKLLYRAIVIRLDVSHAKDAFKLFETINNRGLKLSPTDIIKNSVLGNAARFGDGELSAAKKTWAQLVSNLDGIDPDAFFRYFLISKTWTRLTKAGIVQEFNWYFMNTVKEAERLPERQFYHYWEEEDAEDETDAVEVEKPKIEEAPAVQDEAKLTFQEFLEALSVAAKAYGELQKCNTGVARIDRHLRNLKMIKSAQTYGFLMHLRVGGTPDKVFIKVLELTENFVLRRHVCRERANETETLFAELCELDPKDPVPGLVDRYREATPSDEKFRDEFGSAIYTSNIMERARYCLEQFELSLHGGKHAELAILGAADVHIEHIIPQKIVSKKSQQEFGNWVEYLGEKVVHRHPKFVNRIGNLTLFAGSLNIVASNNPFATKKAAYKKSSFLITRELTSVTQFKFPQVDSRSKQIADFAVSRWPGA